ncbi:C-type lectin domain family 14 member A [Sceloporus undulatus]|uniref:C-type lectin domain family 14 member A n=1 Tax=Sceloporus undulatus TaxID=8520 RepID=UPI001C4B6DC1|nr:C-type lectin domain family 14 member A [Sceloporus undulatus]
MRGLALASLLLLLLPFVGAGVSGAQGAPLTWCQGSSGACYSLHRARLPFPKAQEACAEEGGALSTARGPVEIRALLALLGRASKNGSVGGGGGGGASLFWLGLARKAQQCTLEELPLRGFSWEGVPQGEEEEAPPEWLREPSKSCTLARCAGLEVRLGQPRLAPWGLREQPCAKESLGYICKYSYDGASCPEVLPSLASSSSLGPLLLYRLPFSRLQSATALESSPPGTELTLQCPLGRQERFVCRLSPDEGGSSYWEGTQERLCSCPTGYWSPLEAACVEAHRCLGAQGGFLCLCATRGFHLGADPVSCLRDVESGTPSSLPPTPTHQPPNSTGQLGTNATIEEGLPSGAGDEEKPLMADSSNYVFILVTLAVVMLVLLIMAALQVFQVCFKLCSSTKATSTTKDEAATTAPLKGDPEASATCTDSENSLQPSKAESQEGPLDEPQPGGGQEELEGPCPQNP